MDQWIIFDIPEKWMNLTNIQGSLEGTAKCWDKDKEKRSKWINMIIRSPSFKNLDKI